VWAIEEDWDPVDLRSNTFEMEWPPRSGRRQSFPELDRASWFGVAEARLKILKGQAVFLDRLLEALVRLTAVSGPRPVACIFHSSFPNPNTKWGILYLGRHLPRCRLWTSAPRDRADQAIPGREMSARVISCSWVRFAPPVAVAATEFACF